MAESGYTLTVSSLYALVVWSLAGLLGNGWWLQLLVMTASACLMVELTNSHVLLRVRSRMVTSTFLVFSCLPVALFGSLSGGLTAFCFLVFIDLLFRTYQQPTAVGTVYYAFLFLGLCSFTFVQILFLVPVVWLMMGARLQSISWNAWKASLLGLLTPYWLFLPILFYNADTDWIVSHFAPLAHPFSVSEEVTLTPLQYLNVFFVLSLFLLSVGHFWLNNIEEKIRNRQFFAVFIVIGLLSAVCLFLQPQHYDPLLRILILCASPLVAHFFVLTHSRVTNVTFMVVLVLTLVLQLFNLYDSLFQSFCNLLQNLWNG